jgi:SAM-dependent methyltransferase
MDVKTFFRKVHKRIFERGIGKIFYQSSFDHLASSHFPARLIRWFNQSLTEKGILPPWIYTKEECLLFWQSIDNASTSVGNRPAEYAGKSKTSIDFLDQFWFPPVQKNDSILELGSNCGANLNFLSLLGYSRLSGIEINPNALQQMKVSFPDLTSRASIVEDSLERCLPNLPDNSYDVVFTMGVAMHIHPTSNYLFKHIARVARKFVCSIEPESDNSNYVFARNYRRVYQSHGLVQLKSALITSAAYPNVYEQILGSIIRLFKKR